MSTYMQFLVVVFVLSLTCMPLAAQEKYALLVGVTKYKSSHMNENPLQFPEDDATAVAAELKKSGYTVKTLVGKQASQQGIQDALKALSKQGDEGGVALIGFFGHGVQYGNDAYFCPWDASIDIVKDSKGNKIRDENDNPKLEPDPDSLVSMREILDALTLCNAGNKVLLADCCREDPSRARGRAFGSKLRVADLPSGTAALFACSANEQAFEHKDWGHGAFTLSLLDQLRSADRQLTANVLGVDLYRSVTQRVKEKTKGRNTQTVNLIVNGIVEMKITSGSSPAKSVVRPEGLSAKDSYSEEQRQATIAILNSAEVQNLMKPFFAKSLARISGSLAHFAGEPNTYVANKAKSGTTRKPMSLKTIKRSGALKTDGNERENNLALRQLVCLALVKNDQRPDWEWPRNPTEADWNRVRKAQALLNKHGDFMLKHGYLNE